VLKNDAFWRRDFLEDAVVRIFRVARSVHDVFPFTSDAEIQQLSCHRKTAWAPPVHDGFGIRPGLPNQFARRVEFACDENFAVQVIH
jgi:hypothetical protein